MNGAHVRERRGFTLIEMLVALLLFSVVMAATLRVLSAESRSFALGSERTAMYQNARFALNEMEKDLRTTGAGSADGQPELIYVSDSVIAVNANYWTNTTGDVEAVYYNPDAPDSAVAAMRITAKITIPYTAVLYPDSNFLSGGVNSGAETLLFYFQVDTSTSRTDDYILYRRVNNLSPEVVATNILRTGTTPFFQYFKLTTVALSGVQSLDTVARTSLPWRHTAAIHLSVTDIGTAARIDSIRAVRVNFTVNNGKLGASERLRTQSRLIRLPNAGLVTTKSCGSVPVFSATPALDWDAGTARVQFVASVDEASGEEDVERYVIWRRVSTTTEWGDPYATVTSGAGPYTYRDAAVTSGLSYYYAVAAQDCTPTLSALRLTTMLTIP